MGTNDKQYRQSSSSMLLLTLDTRDVNACSNGSYTSLFHFSAGGPDDDVFPTEDGGLSVSWLGELLELETALEVQM